MDHNYDALLEAAIGRLPPPEKPAPEPATGPKHYSVDHDRRDSLIHCILRSVEPYSASILRLSSKTFMHITFQDYMRICKNHVKIENGADGPKPDDPEYDQAPFEWIVTPCEDGES
jgi:hypothetical protein